MFSTAMHLLPIKDLKDLRAFFWIGDTIDMQDLKALKRFFLTRTLAGDRPPRYGPGKGFSSPCAVRDQASPNYSLLKVCKTLMSIEYAAYPSPQGP